MEYMFVYSPFKGFLTIGNGEKYTITVHVRWTEQTEWYYEYNVVQKMRVAGLEIVGVIAQALYVFAMNVEDLKKDPISDFIEGHIILNDKFGSIRRSNV